MFMYVCVYIYLCVYPVIFLYGFEGFRQIEVAGFPWCSSDIL